MDSTGGDITFLRGCISSPTRTADKPYFLFQYRLSHWYSDMLISETSEGQLVVGHRDHGGEKGWVHPSFRNEHLQSILSPYPSIFYSINCRTGRFDYNPSDSFAEDMNHFEMYHVVGDPTLQLWAEEPAPIRLSASILRNNLNIHVCPIPAEAVVTIWYRGKLVKRAAFTSARMSIPVSDLLLTSSQMPASRRYIEVCISAPGHRYTQTRVNLA